MRQGAVQCHVLRRALGLTVYSQRFPLPLCHGIRVRSVLIPSFVLLLLWSSALHGQNDPRNSIKGPMTVRSGEPAEISWNCPDATSVIMIGDTSVYPAAHSLTLRPSSSITVTFDVLRGTDTSRMSWTINVPGRDTVRVRRGGEIRSYSLPPSPSTTASAYYAGYDPRGAVSAVSRLKILRVDVPDSTHGDYVVQAALLDSLGNNIASIPPSSLIASTRVSCDGAASVGETQGSDVLWTKSQRHMIMTVCMDRSAFAQSRDAGIRDAVAAFTFSLGSGDQLSVVGYNVESTTVCTHSSKDKLNNLAEMFSGEAEGLSALYRSAYACLNRFDASSGYDNTLVVIATGYDNASLIYSADDVIARARARNARIMTIGIGDMVDAYSLQLMASRTGGRAYFLADTDISSITDILREINNGIHAPYTFRVPGRTPAAGSCDMGVLTIGLGSNPALRDSIAILSERDFSLPHRQLLCLFPFGQSALNSAYISHLRKLINVLRDNPDKSVELISHSFAEGDEETSLLLSDERVRVVRKLLLDSGVSPVALRCRAMADVRPLFPYAREAWQADLNRSVEVRWLDPSLLPFEIVTEYVESERDAQSAVQMWLKRSYQAYYEAVVVRGTPVFRVKLWGYESEAGARDAAAIIKKKYNVSAEIE